MPVSAKHVPGRFRTTRWCDIASQTSDGSAPSQHQDQSRNALGVYPVSPDKDDDEDVDNNAEQDVGNDDEQDVGNDAERDAANDAEQGVGNDAEQDVGADAENADVGNVHDQWNSRPQEHCTFGTAWQTRQDNLQAAQNGDLSRFWAMFLAKPGLFWSFVLGTWPFP